MNALLKAALAGTGRAAEVPAGLLEVRGAPEQRLALLAGAQAVAARAGLVPETRPPPSPAPPDALPPCSARAGETLAVLLAENEIALAREAGHLLEARGRRLRHELLPAALDARDPTLREALRPALDARGAWLAALRPEWSWALTSGGADLALQWEEGALPQRLAALRAFPDDRARAALEAVWKKEHADVRAALLAALGPRAGEPFLERALDDRAQAVRTAAALALARLPASAFAGRMRARGALRATTSGSALLGRKALRLELALPEPDVALQRDLAGRLPGSRAALVTELLSLIDPAEWEARFEAAPSTLCAAAAAHDDADALLDGFTAAALHFRRAAWAPPLFEALRARDDATPARRALLALAPEPEALAAQVLADPYRSRLSPADALSTLATFSEAFAARYRAALVHHLRTAAFSHDDPFFPTLRVAALRVPRAAFDPLAALELPDEFERAPWANEWQRFRRILWQRKALHEEI